MKLDEKKLRAKGWSTEDIEHAKGIINHAEENKHPRLRFLEEAIYWIILAIIEFPFI